MKGDGRTLKVRLVEDWPKTKDWRILNEAWGLELSLCTGIARRVPLRKLFHGEALRYVEKGLPGDWSKIKGVATAISEMTDSEFYHEMGSLNKNKKHAEIMSRATELLMTAMESTGVGKIGKDAYTLTLW